jgi:hypothetical protein
MVNIWLVSDRTKRLFSNLSKTDFAFLPVDSEVDVGVEPVTIWLCDIIPVLDAIDDSRSRVDAVVGDSGERIHKIIANGSLIFDEEVVGSHHSFRLTSNFLTVVCDEIFKNAIIEAGLTGSFRDASAF